MLTQRSNRLTPADYLHMERSAEFRSEYLDGEIFAMAGASRSHNQITANLVRVLGNQLGGRSCTVFSSDMKVRVDRPRKFCYPDVVAVCGDARFEDDQEDVLLNPVLIIEVLSDSTEAYDRGLKFFHYQQIPSLMEYILVSQRSRLVERFIRQTDNGWHYFEFHEPDVGLNLVTIDCSLRLGDIYDKVPGMGEVDEEAGMELP